MSEGIVIIRPSFMKLCQDGCRAALFNHIFYWIAKKAMDQSQEALQAGEVTYYATSEELVEQMAGAWGICKVRNAVNDIINLGIIGRGKNPKWGADRTKYFFFSKEQYTKLVELCKKHTICLAHIGLPKEMIALLSVFSQSVECPCTGKMVNLSNANDKSIECSEHKQTINLSNANDKSIGAITKVTTKDTKTKVTERKNGATPAKQETSHSSIPSSSHSQISFSQETKPEEVTFAEEEQAIYDYGRQTLFKAKPLLKTAKLKGECAELAKHITTLEQFQSLLQFVRALPYIQGQVHLKNLVNGLDGWMQ